MAERAHVKPKAEGGGVGWVGGGRQGEPGRKQTLRLVSVVYIPLSKAYGVVESLWPICRRL